jgi:hypothetical protein
MMQRKIKHARSNDIFLLLSSKRKPSTLLHRHHVISSKAARDDRLINRPNRNSNNKTPLDFFEEACLCQTMTNLMLRSFKWVSLLEIYSFFAKCTKRKIRLEITQVEA